MERRLSLRALPQSWRLPAAALVLTAVALSWPLALPAAEEPVELAAFNAGVAAYRVGDYETALERFDEAQALGLSSDQLRFNLGLTYYKLEEYLAARRLFEALLGSRGFAAVSEYHLGLVSAQTGEFAEAADHFRKVREMNVAPELRQMALVGLQRLGIEVGVPRWSVILGGAGGLDTNRTQSSESERFAGVDPESAFGEGSAVVRYFPAFVRQSELRAVIFARDYRDGHAFDQGSGQLSVRKSWASRRWQWTLAGEAESAFLGDDRFQSATSLGAEALWSAGAAGVLLRYRPSFIEGGEEYGYVDGWMHRLELAYSYGQGQTRVRVAYEGEDNDRHDLERGTEFFSQSPLRNGVSLRFAHPVTERLSLDWNGRYRLSRYKDRSRVFEPDGFVEERRVDRQTQLGLVIQYRLTPEWRMRMDYRYTNNRSEFLRYDYDRQTMLLGFEWMPD